MKIEGKEYRTIWFDEKDQSVKIHFKKTASQLPRSDRSRLIPFEIPLRGLLKVNEAISS